MLRRGYALHILNDVTYGQIVNMRNLPVGVPHPELDRIFENFDLWERRYISPIVRETEMDYADDMPQKLPSETIYPGTRILKDLHWRQYTTNILFSPFPTTFLFFSGKCPDTVEGPLVTELFCDHLIDRAEKVDAWWESNTTEFESLHQCVHGSNMC